MRILLVEDDKLIGDAVRHRRRADRRQSIRQ